MRISTEKETEKKEKKKEKESVIGFKVKHVWLDWNLVEEGNGQKKALSMIHDFCVQSESCLGYVYRTNPDGQADAISGATFYVSSVFLEFPLSVAREMLHNIRKCSS